MSCGAKFAHLVPSPPGFDLSDWQSWKSVIGWSDYSERKAAADRIHGYVREGMDQVGTATALEKVQGLHAYLAAYDELPATTFHTTSPDAHAIALVQANAEDGTCMLERLAAAGASGLVPATGTGPGGKSIIGQAASWLFVAGAAYGLWWIAKGGRIE